MGLYYLFSGFLIGLSVSVPLGPIGVMCIQKTINKGRKAGFISGTGAIFGDTFYAIIASFGLGYVSDFLFAQKFFLSLIGGALLIYLGLSIFFSHPAKHFRQKTKQGNYLSDFIYVFFLTLSNPVTIATFGALFTWFGLVTSDSDNGNIMILVAGIFLGTTSWWYFLSTIINKFRTKIRLRNIWWINKITGSIIAFLGLIFVGIVLIPRQVLNNVLLLFN